jgi:hypothetical protein
MTVQRGGCANIILVKERHHEHRSKNLARRHAADAFLQYRLRVLFRA